MAYSQELITHSRPFIEKHVPFCTPPYLFLVALPAAEAVPSAHRGGSHAGVSHRRG